MYLGWGDKKYVQNIGGETSQNCLEDREGSRSIILRWILGKSVVRWAELAQNFNITGAKLYFY
jgi:hypothetical protein